METGLELWLALLRHSKDYVEGIHNLFPRIPQMLDTDLDNLKQVRCAWTVREANGERRLAVWHGLALDYNRRRWCHLSCAVIDRVLCCRARSCLFGWSVVAVAGEITIAFEPSLFFVSIYVCFEKHVIVV